MMNFIETERSFFGRQEILGLLKRRVLDLKEGYRQNVALLGSQYIGKSFLLQKFISDLDDPQIIPVYLDLDQKGFSYFFENFAGNILYHFSKSKGLPLHEDISLLIESLKKVLPQTVDAIVAIQKMISKDRFAEACRQLLSLPETFTLESGKFCLIVVDEFHFFEDFPVTDIFQEIGKRVMTQKRCLYIFSSSLKGVAKKILSEKLSLLFGHFETVEINAFDSKTTQQFVSERLKDIRIGEDLKNFLFNFTAGHPLYLDILTLEIRYQSLIHKQPVVFLPIVSKAIENTIFDRWGVLSRHFEIMMGSLFAVKNLKEIYPILIALANNKHKAEELISHCGFKKNFIDQRISRLMEIGVVEKAGNFYYLNDKLFRYWIKYVFQKRIKNIDCDPQRLRKNFCQELAQAAERFQAASQTDLSSRVVELLQCFGKQTFSCQGRRYRLPVFHKIKPIKLVETQMQSLDMIKASAREGPWLIAFKQNPLSNSDIDLFIAESKKLSQKPQKRILISLENLEDPIRLKALQEKMWIWSQGELNLLLNMYDKPYITQ